MLRNVFIILLTIHYAYGVYCSTTNYYINAEFNISQGHTLTSLKTIQFFFKTKLHSWPVQSSISIDRENETLFRCRFLKHDNVVIINMDDYYRIKSTYSNLKLSIDIHFLKFHDEDTLWKIQYSLDLPNDSPLCQFLVNPHQSFALNISMNLFNTTDYVREFRENDIVQINCKNYPSNYFLKPKSDIFLPLNTPIRKHVIEKNGTYIVIKLIRHLYGKVFYCRTLYGKRHIAYGRFKFRLDSFDATSKQYFSGISNYQLFIIISFIVMCLFVLAVIEGIYLLICKLRADTTEEMLYQHKFELRLRLSSFTYTLLTDYIHLNKNYFKQVEERNKDNKFRIKPGCIALKSNKQPKAKEILNELEKTQLKKNWRLSIFNNEYLKKYFSRRTTTRASTKPSETEPTTSYA